MYRDGTLHNDMESKGTEHYQLLWKLACSSITISLHSVQLPKVPKDPYGSKKFHELACGSISLHAVP